VLQIYQRTCFESESQLFSVSLFFSFRCYKYTKELVLKANHNSTTIFFGGGVGVTNIPKNLFWKRITTFLNLAIMVVLVLQIYQRTCFESESQPGVLVWSYTGRCYKYTKELVLKANHNYCMPCNCSCEGVTNIPKNLFWKRITTTDMRRRYQLKVLQIYQRTCFESESQQLLWIIPTAGWCYKYTKELVLKANHNKEELIFYSLPGVTNIPKNLFWKRITTCKRRYKSKRWVLQIYQRTCFESESQRRRYSSRTV